MRFHKDEESSMAEFREAYEYVKRPNVKRRKQAIKEQRIAKVDLVQNMNNFFNLITNQ